MLLTLYFTLSETERFYSQPALGLKIRVGNEEFIPVHGPVAEYVATGYVAIRKMESEGKEEIVRREIAGFEPLSSTGPT